MAFVFRLVIVHFSKGDGMFFKSLVHLCGAALFCASFAQPYLNTSLPLSQRLTDLMGRLSTAQKITLLHDLPNAVTGLVPNFDINGEALHGVMRPGWFTVFPSALGMAASWDTALLKNTTTVISDEGRARYNELGSNQVAGAALLAFWAPVINMARDPRWGRTGECYGEDPYLAGKLASAFVKGMQGSDTTYIKCNATLKHFAVYSKENGRFSSNAIVNEQVLREYYLEAFRIGVQEGKVRAIMTSYASFNGIPSTGNKRLLTDILKTEWGFDGYVCSDCGALTSIYNDKHYTTGALQTAALCLNAGLDWEACCTCGSYWYQQYLAQAITQGLTTTAALDSAVKRGLIARFKLGLLDGTPQCPYNSIPASKRGAPENVAQARQVVRESIVLLKNAGVNGAPLLPINKTTVRSIAVVGPDAGRVRLDDYACSTPANPLVVPVDGLVAQSGTVKINYVPYPGQSYSYSPLDTIFYPGDSTKHGFLGEYFQNATLTGTPYRTRRDTAIDFTTDNIQTHSGGNDTLFTGAVFSVRWTGTLKPGFTGQYTMAVTTDDGVRVYLNNVIQLDQWVIRGPTTNTVTLSLTAGQKYALRIEYFNNGGGGLADVVWSVPARDNLTAAKQAAAASDIVIAFMGSTDEAEGTDRTTIVFPADQESYLQQIYASNAKIILVVMSRPPLALVWENQNIPAILQAWWPGEQAGNGIADVLYGSYNPGGRLPMTWFSGDNQLMSIDEYDITKGRTYMYYSGTPLYPFGYGLSYTTFSYSNLRVAPSTIGPACTCDVKVDIINTGSCAGDEVPQLYIHDGGASVTRPIRQLKGFTRVTLSPGQTRTVTFRLPYWNLAYYDTTARSWAVKQGAFDIMAGSSSQNIKLTTMVTADRNAICATGSIDNGIAALLAAAPTQFRMLSGMPMTIATRPFIGRGFVINIYNLQGKKLGSIPIGRQAKVRLPSRFAGAWGILFAKIVQEKK